MLAHDVRVTGPGRGPAPARGRCRAARDRGRGGGRYAAARTGAVTAAAAARRAAGAGSPCDHVVVLDLAQDDASRRGRRRATWPARAARDRGRRAPGRRGRRAPRGTPRRDPAHRGGARPAPPARRGVVALLSHRRPRALLVPRRSRRSRRRRSCGCGRGRAWGRGARGRPSPARAPGQARRWSARPPRAAAARAAVAVARLLVDGAVVHALDVHRAHLIGAGGGCTAPDRPAASRRAPARAARRPRRRCDQRSAPAAILVAFGGHVTCLLRVLPDGRQAPPRTHASSLKAAGKPSSRAGKTRMPGRSRSLKWPCGRTPAHPVRRGRASISRAVLARARARGLRAGRGADRRPRRSGSPSARTRRSCCST